MTDSYLYDSFGNALLRGATTNPFQCIGQLGYYFDADLDFYYIRARYFNSLTGRFQSVDPSSRTASFSAYVYSENNPALLTDPSGLDPAYFDNPYAKEGEGAACSDSNFVNWRMAGEEMGQPEGCTWAFIKTDKGCCSGSTPLYNTIKIFYSTMTKVNGATSCNAGAEEEFKLFNLKGRLLGGAIGNASSNCGPASADIKINSPAKIPPNPKNPRDCSWFEWVIKCIINCDPSSPSPGCEPACEPGKCFVPSGEAQVHFTPKPGVQQRGREYLSVVWNTNFLDPKVCETAPCKDSITPREV